VRISTFSALSSCAVIILSASFSAKYMTSKD